MEDLAEQAVDDLMDIESMTAELAGEHQTVVPHGLSERRHE